MPFCPTRKNKRRSQLGAAITIIFYKPLKTVANSFLTFLTETSYSSSLFTGDDRILLPVWALDAYNIQTSPCLFSGSSQLFLAVDKIYFPRKTKCVLQLLFGRWETKINFNFRQVIILFFQHQHFSHSTCFPEANQIQHDALFREHVLH